MPVNGIWDLTWRLTLNIPSLARERCLPSWGPRRSPWFFCNSLTVWCGRLLKLCFLGFWNYISVIQALLASYILCLFIYFNRSNRGHGTSPHSLITHPAFEQCHLLSIVGGPFFKFTTFGNLKITRITTFRIIPSGVPVGPQVCF